MESDLNSVKLAGRLRRDPVIAILRDLDPQSTASMARELFAMGIEHVEVTIQDAQGIDALRATVALCGEQDRHIGAGSIISLAMAELAVDIGANFLVSPGLSSSIVKVAQSRGVAVLPGVATPSEIQKAISLGLQAVKTLSGLPTGRCWLRSCPERPFPRGRIRPNGWHRPWQH